jgi:hypothetical protein
MLVIKSLIIAMMRPSPEAVRVRLDSETLCCAILHTSARCVPRHSCYVGARTGDRKYSALTHFIVKVARMVVCSLLDLRTSGSQREPHILQYPPCPLKTSLTRCHHFTIIPSRVIH